MTNHPEAILGIPIKRLMSMLPHWQYGKDRVGRPMMYKVYKNIDASQLKADPGFEKLVKYHIWELEHTMELCVDQSHRTGM